MLIQNLERLAVNNCEDYNAVCFTIQGVSKKVRQFWNCSQFHNSVHEM
jgi:hypothetical protein